MTALRRASKSALPFAAAAVAVLFAACSGRVAEIAAQVPDGGKGEDGGRDGGPSSAVPEAGGADASACPTSTLHITYSPMYSAYVSGDPALAFQVAAITDAQTGVTVVWSASDPELVALAPYPGIDGAVLLTVQGTGAVTVLARGSDGSCASAPLTISQGTDQDWQIGDARYNQGTALHFTGEDAGATYDAGVACASCHGPTAQNLAVTVPCSPMQLAGTSDQQLIDIFLRGVIPDGGWFDPDLIIPDASADPTGQTEALAYAEWQPSHRFADITADEQQGMVVYLRSLAPAPTDPVINPGGGPGHHHDAGLDAADGSQ